MPGFKGLPRNISSAARGYGAAHRRARAQAFAALPEWSPCVRCGKPMWKWAKDKHGKSALHFDHNDDRTGYLGFSHGDTCNVKAGAAKGGRNAGKGPGKTERTPPPKSWRSRTW